MDAALIAVVGTLSGVVLTATAGILTALITARSQRALAEIQAARERQKADRAERRADFAAFMKAYDDVFAGGHYLLARAQAGENGLDAQKELTEQIRQFKQAYLILCITTTADVRDSASRCLGSIWEMHDAAVTGDSDLFLKAAKATQAPRDEVRAAMRAQLGVVEA